MSWYQIAIPREEEIASMVAFVSFIGLISIWFIFIGALLTFGLMFYSRLKEAANL